MNTCVTNRCKQGRRICPTPSLCVPLQTATDSGHKIAHGRRTDYFGQAAEGNPGFPFELVEAEAVPEVPQPWYERVPFKFFVIAGAVIGIAVGIYRYFF